MSPTRAAVVFIPDDVECGDGLYARQGVAHIERRGNKFVGVMRDWGHVLRLAAEGVVVVFAKREHCPSLATGEIRREFVGEETCRLIPIVQENATGYRAADSAGPRLGRHRGRAAPFDESPTVAILDRWRATMKRHNGRVPASTSPPGDDGGFAERFLQDRYRQS